MAEFQVQSAFAAYKKNNKASVGAKQNVNKGAKNKVNSEKGKGNASTGTGNNQTNKSTATKSALKSNVHTKSVGQKSKDRRSNGTQHEFDELVTEMLNDSHSKKPQVKKKSELEAFLNQFEEGESSSDEEDESTSDDDDEEDETENGDSEYTLNSDTYSSSEDEATENAPEVNSDIENHGENSQEDAPFSLQALRSANVKAGKRKSNNGEEIKGKNASTSKKTKTTNESKSKNPETTSTIVQSEKAAECKRDSVGTKGAMPKSTEVPSTSHKKVEKTAIKLEPRSPLSNVVKMNSVTEGKKMLQWLLRPIGIDNFFSNYWEKNVCLVCRPQNDYFSHLISFEAIDQMLLQHHVEFTKNIDVTSYKNGVRETLNPEGRATPPVVWDLYGQGCSIRLLNPQTFLPNLFTLNTTMQEYFHCMVGANVYLTPPNSQGFAPHYDDIEAFVLQIEGRKRWKLYAPRNKNEALPRLSSPNFTQEEIGNPILDEVLEPGYVLYFPRGTIHQASTEPGFHSLHITLSVYQKNSFADLFEKMVPLILEHAIAANVDMRHGLPLHTWHHAGIAFSDNDTQERAEFQQKVFNLLQKTIRNAPLEHILDAAVDQMAKKFQHEALPPEVLPSERLRTMFGSRSKPNERGECVCDYEMDLRTNMRLLRANIIRLVEEDHKLRVYYYLDNSKEYCEYETNYIEIDPKDADSIQVLIRSYPEYVSVSQLPQPDDEQKIEFATALWERGLLMTEKPFRLD